MILSIQLLKYLNYGIRQISSNISDFERSVFSEFFLVLFYSSSSDDPTCVDKETLVCESVWRGVPVFGLMYSHLFVCIIIYIEECTERKDKSLSFRYCRTNVSCETFAICYSRVLCEDKVNVALALWSRALWGCVKSARFNLTYKLKGLFWLKFIYLISVLNLLHIQFMK